jgi:hypothetical protein
MENNINLGFPISLFTLIFNLNDTTKTVERTF